MCVRRTWENLKLGSVNKVGEILFTGPALAECII